MILDTILSVLHSELPDAYTIRREYAYGMPSNDGLVYRRLDAAVFSSPLPSIDTALVGFLELQSNVVQDELVRDLGYFGAPLAVLFTETSCTVYKYQAPLVGEIEQEVSHDIGKWIRDELIPMIQDENLLFPTAGTRDLISLEVKSSLSSQVKTLMEEYISSAHVPVMNAFLSAMTVLRSQLLGKATLTHLPTEAIADLYESLAVDDSIRRRHGVVYTPPWLARWLVNRLPYSAFFGGRSVDPTCGSGTFLATFLERAILERRKRQVPLDQEDLRQLVMGLDIDRVAIELTRLTLDLVLQKLDPTMEVDWHLEVGDATATTVDASTLIGNLPFGYRTHGALDTSSVILQHWLEGRSTINHIALVLPDSFAYAMSAKDARRTLRETFRIDEIIKLPEGVFATSGAATIGLLATRYSKLPVDAVVVREVNTPAELDTFRLEGTTPRSFAASLPDATSDQWILSPFYDEFESAFQHQQWILGDLCDLRFGLQPYGSPQHDVFGTPDEGPVILEDARQFSSFGIRRNIVLRAFVGDPYAVRRSGPVDLFVGPKVIIRATSNPGYRSRLMAVIDTQGMWFTDKFIGIWKRDGVGPSLAALAAYFQSTFAQVWLASYNPSRKIRIRTLAKLPIPKLPEEWWDRAATMLAHQDRIVRGSRMTRALNTALFTSDLPDHSENDWAWFDSVINTAFGISIGSATEMMAFIRRLRDDYHD